MNNYKVKFISIDKHNGDNYIIHFKYRKPTILKNRKKTYKIKDCVFTLSLDRNKNSAEITSKSFYSTTEIRKILGWLDYDDILCWLKLNKRFINWL